jgi:endo-1,4-beta-xylanase
LAFLGLLVLAVLPVLNLRTDIAGASPTCDPYAPATCTLRQLADLAGIRIGSTAEPSETTEPAYTSVLAREFNSLTPENSLKWYATQPSPGTWDFAGADAVVQFAEDHDMAVRGHTLVWAQDTYTPAWVKSITDPVALKTAVDNQITTTMNHFAGKIHRWDVVNEPLVSLGTGLSASVFWDLGPEWIADAFRLARSLDPDAELWLNEYGSDWVPGKHEALVALVRQLVDAGVPIDGVGIQTHRLPGAVLDAERFASQLRDFTALGLAVAITELDVPVSPTDPDAFEFQAAEYARVVSACLTVDGCVEVTVWGLTDGSTWLDSLGLFPTPTRPLLFDTTFAPKPAYDAIRRVLSEAVAPQVTPTTESVQPTGAPDPELPVTGSGTGALAASGLVLIAGGLLIGRTTQRSRCSSFIQPRKG